MTEYADRDLAFTEIAQGIEELVEYVNGTTAREPSS